MSGCHTYLVVEHGDVARVALQHLLAARGAQVAGQAQRAARVGGFQLREVRVRRKAGAESFRNNLPNDTTTRHNTRQHTHTHAPQFRRSKTQRYHSACSRVLVSMRLTAK
jgi:hypothetical protein